MLHSTGADVPRITPDAAKALIERGNTLVVDVRERYELVRGGKISGALHVPCGVLEGRADPKSPSYDSVFDKSKTIVLYCAAGERSATSGARLKAMGYAEVYNLGSFADWVDCGGPVEAVR